MDINICFSQSDYILSVIRRLQGRIIDLVPEMNGDDLRKIIGEKRPGIKTVFISGYAPDTIEQRGVLAEGINFIQKPFTLQDLAMRIYSVMTKA